MKTAVSIPTPLFEAADRRARRLGITRSELYAQALERILADDPEWDITRRLDDVYAVEGSSLDEGLSQAQRRATAEEW